MMHGAVGTALGGVCTLVGEPQNLLIGSEMGWHFMPTFLSRSLRFPCRCWWSGLRTCYYVEKKKWFSYGC